MAVFEVWKSKDGLQTEMIRRGAKRVSDPGDYIIHTFEAHSTFEAFRTHWRLMGWGEWKPEPDWIDEPIQDN
jgi:hypothetical protein